jgi:hypothetical protein
MFRVPAIRAFCLQAQARAKSIGTLNDSIRQGAGNYVGCLFEVAHMCLFGGETSTGKDIYQYDILDPKWGRVDCKSKERTLPTVDPNWEASVADHAGMGANQDCDYYAFGSVSVDFQKNPTWIWFMGYIPKEEYFNGKDNVGDVQGTELDSRGREIKRWNDLRTGAEFRKEGLPYDDNGFICSEDCWNRKYNYLYQYNVADIPYKKNLENVIKQSRTQGWGGDLKHILKGER